MIRWALGLLLLGFVLDVVWPQPARDQAAAAVAHSYCAARPLPEACAPGGHPYDAIKRPMGLATPPGMGR